VEGNGRTAESGNWARRIFSLMDNIVPQMLTSNLQHLALVIVSRMI